MGKSGNRVGTGAVYVDDRRTINDEPLRPRLCSKCLKHASPEVWRIEENDSRAEAVWYKPRDRGGSVVIRHDVEASHLGDTAEYCIR